MKHESWNQIERIYHEALELEPEARWKFLEQECGGNEELRHEVASLLSYDGPDSFFDAPAQRLAAQLNGDEQATQMFDSLSSISNGLTKSESESRPAPPIFIGDNRILRKLGDGGMGIVYEAEQQHLRRNVALKVIRGGRLVDEYQVKMFQREVQALARLKHPGIAAIYEAGRTDEGQHYFVMELVRGIPLLDYVKGGLLTGRQAPRSARQRLELFLKICEAISYAHQRGVIHRDLKPANILVADESEEQSLGGSSASRVEVKVLDFGLARITDEDGVGTSSLSQAGQIRGTLPYMSPEQVRGETGQIDIGVDVYALGVILYELLTERLPYDFQQASLPQAIRIICEEMPKPLNRAKGESRDQESGTAERIDRDVETIVLKALEKEPERRYQSAAAMAEDVTRYLSNKSIQARQPSALYRFRKLVDQRKAPFALQAIVSVLLLGMLGLAWAYYTRQPMTNEAQATKLSILPPEKSSFSHIAISPDGRYLAFTAVLGGKAQLWVRALDSTEARALAGTQGARYPFWSPDSRFLGFFDDYRLKKIEGAGGQVQTLCEAPYPFGGAWSRDGVILFGQPAGGLSRISAEGGIVAQVTTLDEARRENSHRNPTFLPDGRHFLYSIQSGQKETFGVYLGSLDSAIKRRLLDNVTIIKYVAGLSNGTDGDKGWLIFGRDGALLAQPFDVRQLEFTGKPFALSDEVGSDLIDINYFTFSVSDNGVLVFDPSLKRQRRQYFWVDRSGRQINSLDIAADLFQHQLSPDEKRFVTARAHPVTGASDLWLYDVSRGGAIRFTFDPANDFNPVWSPDGSRIVWASNRDGEVANLYQKEASGIGEQMLLLKSDYLKIPTDWSRDGRFIIYCQNDHKTKFDIWVLPAEGSGEAKPFPVIRTEANETAGTLSPDGRWLSYASDESGRYEIFIQGFPRGSRKRQVSTGGGNNPHWRRDGRELFYYSGDGKLMAAPVRGDKGFETGAPVSLFEFRAGTLPRFAPYAVKADGQQFLINAIVETEPSAPLTVWVNWAARMKK